MTRVEPSRAELKDSVKVELIVESGTNCRGSIVLLDSINSGVYPMVAKEEEEEVSMAYF